MNACRCSCDRERIIKGTIGIVSLVLLICLLFCPHRCHRRPPVTPAPVPSTVAVPVPPTVAVPVPILPSTPPPEIAIVQPELPLIPPDLPVAVPEASIPAVPIAVPLPPVPTQAEAPRVRHPGTSKTVEVFGGTATACGSMATDQVAPAHAFDRNSRTAFEEGIADLPVGDGRAASIAFTYRPGYSRAILAYAITSAEDGLPGGDPAAWRLVGVLAEGGERELDRRQGEVFGQHPERRVFSLEGVPPCTSYRIEFQAAADGGSRVRMAEVEFIIQR